MLSPLFGYSASLPASPGDMEAGDFDRTPNPSARPSVAALKSSPRADVSSNNTPLIARTASYRHHLLKTSTSGAILADTEISAPPVLSHSSPPLPLGRGPEVLEATVQPENMPTGGMEAIPPPKTSSSILQLKNRGVSPDIPASERVCLDPGLHVNETHAHVHHPGLLKGADFCDIGAPTKEVVVTNLSSPKSVSSDGVGTSGHSRMVKVRPAFNYHPMHDIVNQSPGHGLPYGQVSKVKSFKDLLELEGDSERKSTSLSEGRSSTTGDSANINKELLLNIPLAKVRPFHDDEEKVTAAQTPRFFDAQEKVKPFDEQVESNQQLLSQDDPLKLPPLQDDEISGGQPSERVPAKGHTICDDDAYPVESQDETFTYETHPEAHEMVACAKAPTETQAPTHRISKCEKCAAGAEIRTHSMGACFLPPSPTNTSTISAPKPIVDEVQSRIDDLGLTLDSWPIDKGAKRSRSDSLESGHISTSAMQWLRGILKYPENYSSRLTNFASTVRARELSMLGNRPVSEPARFPGNVSSRPTSDWEPTLDGNAFKKVVNDLQKLLDDAIALACQAADQPLETKCCGTEAPKQIDQHAGNIQVDADSSQSTKHSKTPMYPKRHTIAEGMADDVKFQVAYPPPVHRNLRAIPRRSSSKRQGCQFPEVHHGYCVYCHYHPRCSDDIEGVDFDQGLAGHGPKSQQNLVVHQASVSDFHLTGEDVLPERDVAGRPIVHEHGISLANRSHVSLRGIHGFNLARSHKRRPIARDWSPIRKRFVASVACMSTALIGIILGIYAGLVPKIQYYILDESFVIVHGNTGCFLGLAIPTFFFWPLPLLHGRKPYILGSLGLAMPLLFPQALSVYSQRMTDLSFWRSMLLVSRALMGCALGFASMNFHGTLTDLFGASLMSSAPHEEVVDHLDARRHGGGMGVWLGIWTWCWLGSLSIGFLVGASVIDQQPPAWGFFISIILLAVVLVLNVICPEVRRSAYRRSVTEVWTETGVSRRLARGEVMMHRVKTGPKWWGEEVYHGMLLSTEMMRQPGFAIMSIYVAWIYAQIVLLIILLGSLSSKMYRLTSPYVGLYVGCLALGALFAVPFQKANLFSRSRQSRINSSRATLEKKVAWTTHLARRTAFSILLPIAGGCYAAVSSGPPLHISVPTIFAMCVGFLSSLAVSECNGIIMETFDTSDLSPGMTGRQRGAVGQHQRKTNYSSFPRVTAGYAVIHTQGFVLSAGATALGGHITRTLGQQVTTAIVAALLFLFTVALLLVLTRFKTVRIVPRSESAEMERVVDARRKSLIRLSAMPNDPHAIIEEEEAWQPVMMGNPSSGMRRMNILELGSMSRWQEIRKRNQLIDDETPLCQRVAISQGLEALDDHIRKDAQGILRAASLRGRDSRRVRGSNSASEGTEMGDLRPTGHSIQGTPSPYLERDSYFH